MTSLVHRKRPTNSPPFPSPPLNERLTFSKRFGKKKKKVGGRTERKQKVLLLQGSLVARGTKSIQKRRRQKEEVRKKRSNLRGQKSLSKGAGHRLGSSRASRARNTASLCLLLFRTPVSPLPIPSCICFPFFSLQTDFLGFVWTETDISWLPGF